MNGISIVLDGETLYLFWGSNGGENGAYVWAKDAAEGAKLLAEDSYYKDHPRNAPPTPEQMELVTAKDLRESRVFGYYW